MPAKPYRTISERNMLSVLLVTGSMASFTEADVKLWEGGCVLSSADLWSLSSFLLLDLAAKHALVDVIAFWPSMQDVISDYPLQCVIAIEEIRKLPESCCMRDGRKWKQIPCIVLSDTFAFYGSHHLREANVPIVHYSRHNYYWSFSQTLRQLENAVEKYRERVLAEYFKGATSKRLW